MSLPRDCFGRVVTTHGCPECGARFLSAAMCKGVGDGPGKRAHDHEVQTLPIHGCVEPPPRLWAVGLPQMLMASTESRARGLAQGIVESTFPKSVVERYGDYLRPIPLETVGIANLNRRMEEMRRERIEREQSYGL